MRSNQDQTHFSNQGYLGFRGGDDEINSNQGYLGFRGGDDEINPKSNGIWGGDGGIKARGRHQLRGFPISNFNDRFDVGESRLAKIKAKISVEDFDYLKGFANSNKRIDENDPRLVKIRAKISAEDVDYLKGLANQKFSANNMGTSGRTANFGAHPGSFGNRCTANCSRAPPGGFDNSGSIGGCVFL